MRIDETTISNSEAYVFKELYKKLGVHYTLEQSVKNLRCLNNSKKSSEGNVVDFSWNFELDILCGKNGYYIGVEVQSMHHQYSRTFERDLRKYDECLRYGIPILYFFYDDVVDEDTFMTYKYHNMEVFTSITDMADRIKELLDNPTDKMRMISDEERMEYDSRRLWRDLYNRKMFDPAFKKQMADMHKDYRRKKKEQERQKKQEVEYSWLDHKWNFPSNDDIDVQRKIDSMPLGDAIKEEKINKEKITKNMKKKVKRINESQLRAIVAESVKRILKESINAETKGFLDCIQKLNIQQGGQGNQRIINGKVYSFSLKQWKDAYDTLCNKRGGYITVDEYMNWLDNNCLISNISAEDSINQYKDYKIERDNEVKEKKRTAEIVKNNRAAFENACDYLYYGYGFNSWFKSCKDYISEEDAKIVWKAAFEKMGNED